MSATGHTFVTVYGQFSRPPVGTSRCPLTGYRILVRTSVLKPDAHEKQASLWRATTLAIVQFDLVRSQDLVRRTGPGRCLHFDSKCAP